MKRRIGFYLLMVHFFSLSADWSTVYHKKIDFAELQENKSNYYFFGKEGVPLFSQLLFSWNALRPEHGFFSFYVQVRDAHTHKWGSWHKMVDWGAYVQRSYNSKSDGVSKYSHVRLDTEKYRLADAFRVKIACNKGAPLDAVKSLAVSVSNLHKFEPERDGGHIKQLNSITLQGVPKISQMALDTPLNTRICSPTSCAMVTGYLNNERYCPIDFAKKAYDKGLDAFGSWPFNMAHAYEKCKGTNWFFNTRLNSFTDLHKQLRRGLPVIVSVRGDLPGASQSFPHGHLLVVVGWDSKEKSVICHDPACQSDSEVYKKYKYTDFVKAWDRSHRLCYWVEPVRNNCEKESK
jgi:hypothetical protein